MEWKDKRWYCLFRSLWRVSVRTALCGKLFYTFTAITHETLYYLWFSFNFMTTCIVWHLRNNFDTAEEEIIMWKQQQKRQNHTRSIDVHDVPKARAHTHTNFLSVVIFAVIAMHHIIRLMKLFDSFDERKKKTSNKLLTMKWWQKVYDRCVVRSRSFVRMQFKFTSSGRWKIVGKKSNETGEREKEWKGDGSNAIAV